MQHPFFFYATSRAIEPTDSPLSVSQYYLVRFHACPSMAADARKAGRREWVNQSVDLWSGRV